MPLHTLRARVALTFNGVPIAAGATFTTTHGAAAANLVRAGHAERVEAAPIVPVVPAPDDAPVAVSADD